MVIKDDDINKSQGRNATTLPDRKFQEASEKEGSNTNRTDLAKTTNSSARANQQLTRYRITFTDSPVIVMNSCNIKATRRNSSL